MFLLAALYLIPGLTTVALVSIAARFIEKRALSKFELVLSFLAWPYFLIALIVRLNTNTD